MLHQTPSIPIPILLFAKQKGKRYPHCGEHDAHGCRIFGKPLSGISPRSENFKCGKQLREADYTQIGTAYFYGGSLLHENDNGNLNCSKELEHYAS